MPTQICNSSSGRGIRKSPKMRQIGPERLPFTLFAQTFPNGRRECSLFPLQ